MKVAPFSVRDGAPVHAVCLGFPHSRAGIHGGAVLNSDGTEALNKLISTKGLSAFTRSQLQEAIVTATIPNGLTERQTCHGQQLQVRGFMPRNPLR